MRTRLFNEFANLEKRFQEDFALIWELPRPVQLALIPVIEQLSKAETVGESKQILDKTCKELGADTKSLLKIIKVLQFVRQVWNPITDTPEGFLKDLNDLGLVPPRKSKAVREFLVEFLSSLEKDNLRRLEKTFACSVLPTYVGCDSVVDFRAIFRSPFGSGTNNDWEKYVPDCAGFVPVVIVEIQRDSGDPQNVFFQLEEASLRRLIEALQATLKDVEDGKRVFPPRV